MCYPNRQYIPGRKIQYQHLKGQLSQTGNSKQFNYHPFIGQQNHLQQNRINQHRCIDYTHNEDTFDSYDPNNPQNDQFFQMKYANEPSSDIEFSNTATSNNVESQCNDNNKVHIFNI